MLNFLTVIKIQAVRENLLHSAIWLPSMATKEHSANGTCRAELELAAPSNERAVSILDTFPPIYRTKEKKIGRNHPLIPEEKTNPSHKVQGRTQQPAVLDSVTDTVGLWGVL